MYISLIRPLIVYSDAVWDTCSTESKKKQLDLIHHEAARIITRGTKLCSIQKLLSKLGWETLQERRSNHKLVIFYKVINGLTTDYLSDLLPPIVQYNVTYNLRNANNMRSLRARTNLYFNSFPSTIRAWNELPDEIKGASTVSAFKYQLNKHKKPPPMYFHAGTRKGQILHTRIRMECSSLNSHLYSKNIINSPSCSCGCFESA